MSKFNQVRGVIASLEQGQFQLLCNNYLQVTFGGEMHPPGSVETNNKTRIGRPDSYLFKEDGTYIIAEHTTKDTNDRKAFFKKLDKDLKECLDFEKLKIPASKIRMIIQCCNSAVEPYEREKLATQTAAFSIAYKMVTLDDLAIHYATVGKVFAHQFLGIAYDTGQILDKEQF